MILRTLHRPVRLAGGVWVPHAGRVAVVDVVVVGLVCRDLVLAVGDVPDGGSVPVSRRIETLGGAANQAVAARQLGRTAAVVGVVGDDAAAGLVLDRARRDGIDVSAVVRRGTTPLVVGVVDGHGTNRLFEHVPEPALLTDTDVRAAAPLIAGARAVVADLQQPDPAVVETARLAAEAGAMVVLDGAPDEPDALTEVLPVTTVLRADEDEAAGVLGRPLAGVRDTVAAAVELVAAGPAVVALGAGSAGNVVAWRGGHRVYPLLGGDPVDPTGGGDAFVAGLVCALLDGTDAEAAGWWASAAAALTVARLGGRPQLDRAGVTELAARAARA